MTIDQASKQETYEEQLRAHERQLFAYIFSLVRNLSDAEDVFQETCVALWEQYESFQSGTNFAAWATTVARYRVLKFFEQAKRHQLKFSEQATLQLTEVATRSSSQELFERRDLLAECMKKLPPAQLSLLQQVYGGEVKVSQLSQTLGRTTHSIYSSLRHIRKTLLVCTERALKQGRA